MKQENSTEKDTWDALEAAYRAFEKHLCDCGYDPAYWDIKLTAYIKDASLKHRMARIEYEHEIKE